MLLQQKLCAVLIFPCLHSIVSYHIYILIYWINVKCIPLFSKLLFSLMGPKTFSCWLTICPSASVIDFPRLWGWSVVVEGAGSGSVFVSCLCHFLVTLVASVSSFVKWGYWKHPPLPVIYQLLLSPQFTLQHLLWDNGLDSKHFFTVSTVLSFVSRGRWTDISGARASLLHPSAVVLSSSCNHQAPVVHVDVEERQYPSSPAVNPSTQSLSKLTVLAWPGDHFAGVFPSRTLFTPGLVQPFRVVDSQCSPYARQPALALLHLGHLTPGAPGADVSHPRPRAAMLVSGLLTLVNSACPHPGLSPPSPCWPGTCGPALGWAIRWTSLHPGLTTSLSPMKSESQLYEGLCPSQPNCSIFGYSPSAPGCVFEFSF